MRGGQNLKPAALRALEGGSTVSHRRPPVEAVIGNPVDTTAGETLEAPEHLPLEAVDVWNEVVPTLAEVGLARSVDALALEALCTHLAIARAVMAKLVADGGGALDVDAFISRTAKGVPVVSPWHRILRDSWREAMRVGEHYGLTPVARARLGIALLQRTTLAEQLREIMGDDKSA
jgi:P27 family predicted phage terminase small subunit